MIAVIAQTGSRAAALIMFLNAVVAILSSFIALPSFRVLSDRARFGAIAFSPIRRGIERRAIAPGVFVTFPNPSDRETLAPVQRMVDGVLHDAIVLSGYNAQAARLHMLNENRAIRR